MVAFLANLFRSRLFWLIAVVLGLGSYAIWPVQPPQTVSRNPMAQVTVPDLTAAQQLGKQAFDANCADCHGADAAGQIGKAPPLVHKIYELSHHGDDSFVRAARMGVPQHHWPFGSMPPVAGITDAEIAGIIDYIRALQRANGIN